MWDTQSVNGGMSMDNTDGWMDGRTDLHDALLDALLLLQVLRYAVAHRLVQRDERVRQLAAVLVRRGDHAHVRNIRVVEQMALELRRRDCEGEKRVQRQCVDGTRSSRTLEAAYFDELLRMLRRCVSNG